MGVPHASLEPGGLFQPREKGFILSLRASGTGFHCDLDKDPGLGGNLARREKIRRGKLVVQPASYIRCLILMQEV